MNSGNARSLLGIVMKKNIKFTILLIFISIFCIASLLLWAESEVSSAKVTDISDRKYEKAVIQILDNAKNSIVISMYSISLGKDTNNPVKFLMICENMLDNYVIVANEMSAVIF